MSLLSDQMVDCYFMVKTKEPDGYGGTIDTYTEGTEIKAAIVLDSSLQARIASKDGFKDLYTIITSKGTTLAFNDVIKRKSDSRMFRVKSDGTDKKTPNSASLDMRAVSAELFIE